MAYSPLVGAVFGIVTSMIGVAALLHGWLSRHRERAFRLKHGAKAIAAVMLLGLGLSIWQGGLGSRPDSANAVDRCASLCRC